MERNENICRHTINQAENSITEAHSNPLWSVDSRGAGQFKLLLIFIASLHMKKCQHEGRNVSEGSLMCVLLPSSNCIFLCGYILMSLINQN